MTDTPAHTLTEARAVWLYPSLKSLILIRDAGWKFLPIDVGNEATGLDATRVWPGGWRDCLRVHDENDALGLRIRIAGDKHSTSEIVWERDGTLADVVSELLTLPMPDTKHAPNLAIGRAPRLWTP